MGEAVAQGRILIYGGMENEALEGILKCNGYEIWRAGQESGLREAFAQEASLLMLWLEGTEQETARRLTLLATLRKESTKPILVCMEKENEMLRIMALNVGADDCLGAECSLLEKMARIQAQLRCYRRLVKERPQNRLIRMDGLEVDDEAKLVRVEGNRVKLTPTEYKILHLLLEKPGTVLSNRQIYEGVWKMAPIGADNTIAVHIRHIREKIEENPQNPRYLRVVWGQGYKVG